METSTNNARSTSTVTAATGKQTRRATRRAGVGSAETTLICNLTNVQQLWLPHTDSGVTQAAGQSRGGGGNPKHLCWEDGGVLLLGVRGWVQSIRLPNIYALQVTPRQHVREP